MKLDKENLLLVLGRNVRRLRHAQGLSQERLGEKIGLDRTYISGIERGTRNPSVGSLWKLAQQLDVAVSDLFME